MSAHLFHRIDVYFLTMNNGCESSLKGVFGYSVGKL
jgi:hypothetical protein